MIRVLSLACMLLAAGAAAAEDPPVRPAAVIDVVTADWNGDGAHDRAVLIEAPQDADLRIYLSEDGGMGLAVSRPALVWRGAMWGTQPTLELNPAGSLQVISGNTSVGRTRWQETLTIAFRGGRFVVAGFTFSSYDTFDPGLSRDCDANYLSGRGLLDGAPFEVLHRAVPLADWSGSFVPEQCAAG